MRTTLTIDTDVAAALKRLRKTSDVSFKKLINDVLRRGLRDMSEPRKPRKPYRTRSVDLGGSKIGSLDNIGEVLAILEGETHR
jgi:hypothetical protein